MPPTPLRRLAALGGAVLLAGSAVAACQVGSAGGNGSGEGTDISDAASELLAWHGVTVQAGVDGTAEEVYDYLLHAGGGEQPSMDDARRLADMELTAVFADPAGEDAELRDTEPGTALNSAVAVNFGGEDVAGVKSIGNDTWVKINWEGVVRGVLHGDDAAVEQARRFREDARRLPDSLGLASTALGGGWVKVDPARYDEYAEVLTEHAGMPEAPAAAAADALADVTALLSPQAQWRFLAGLGGLGNAGVTLQEAGEEHGAQVVEVELPAGEAWRVMEPLAAALNEQGARFGLPPLVSEPEEPGAPVVVDVRIRNGVLAGLTLDLGQFAGAGEDGRQAPPLPLDVTLTSGAALSLSSSSGETLTPEDLTVALLYLEVRAEERQGDPGRADVPGPVQP
ncbi:hypothetical protein [Streptomyces sp. 7-21]|uniref:hypothetical protein n=1 Tax=Streptomyces sp. 7-21 TaxID=2802283 RepID=UPI00191F901E|nr:hypothetical protein [Streptomyces sp. 7-21]MBL1065467.1 hypothetical protein [Streptomyces sp. 7-21]